MKELILYFRTIKQYAESYSKFTTITVAYDESKYSCISSKEISLIAQQYDLLIKKFEQKNNISEDEIETLNKKLDEILNKQVRDCMNGFGDKPLKEAYKKDHSTLNLFINTLEHKISIDNSVFFIRLPVLLWAYISRFIGNLLDDIVVSNQMSSYCLAEHILNTSGRNFDNMDLFCLQSFDAAEKSKKLLSKFSNKTLL